MISAREPIGSRDDIRTRADKGYDMRHFDIVDIITEGIHSDERGNLEIDEYNYMFHNILNVHNTISKNDNMINNGLHNLHRKLEIV
jgi:hypothetical protein